MSAMTAPREAPSPRSLPLVGHLPGVMRDPLATFVAISRSHPEVASLWLPPYRCVLLSSADAVRHVNVDNAGNYAKSPSYDGLRLALGQGLITSNGDVWSRHRRMAQPAFHKPRLAGLVRHMHEATMDLVAAWERLDGQVTDAHAAMMRLTLDIVGRALFGASLGNVAGTVSRALSVVVEFAYDYTNLPVHLPLSFPLPSHRRFRRAVADLDGVVTDIIAARRGGGSHDDLLSMLMEARDDETGQGLTDRELRDEVLTMLLAGHETTAGALAWALHLASVHPGWAARVAAEAASLPLDEPPDMEAVMALPGTGLVVHESLRLYPPVWVFDRQAIAADEVAGYHVPAGTIALVCPWSLHRDARYWDRPDAFDPERFLPERSASRPRHAFVPFAAGPRQCMGIHFAMLEMVLVLSSLLRRFAVEPAVPVVEPEALITLRPKGGIPLRIRRRP